MTSMQFERLARHCLCDQLHQPAANGFYWPDQLAGNNLLSIVLCVEDYSHVIAEDFYRSDAVCVDIRNRRALDHRFVHGTTPQGRPTADCRAEYRNSRTAIPQTRKALHFRGNALTPHWPENVQP